MMLGQDEPSALWQSELNSAQQSAVTAPHAHLLVLAGAGSGKTRVLVQRIAWLVAQGHSLHRILAVTFTNKAAAEMRHRIEKTVGVEANRLWVGTFHGLSHRLLRQHGNLCGLPDNFQIIDSEDQLRLMKRLIQERGWDPEVCDPKRAMSFINRQKEEGKRPGHLVSTVMPDVAMFIELYRIYEQHCQRTGTIDFAEILLRSYELLRDNPELLAQYQERFKHILVDEFQDTNTIQYAWLRLLCGKDGHMMVVGDDDQSIYGWRGAKIENIQRFSKDFADTVTIRLEQNYRSTNTILSAANALITHNDKRLGKELWTQGAQGDRITLYGAFNEIDEARFIVDRMKRWHASGGQYEEMAVLYRSNAQSRVLEQTLRSANIPYRIYGGLRFFDRAEIKDALAYLRLSVNCNDDTAFERVLNYPPRGVGDRTLSTIRELASSQSLSLWDAAKAYLPQMPSGRISNGVRQFFEAVDTLIEAVREQPLPEFIQTLLQRSGLLLYVKTQPGERTHAKVENLHELIEAARQFHQAFDELNDTTSVNCQETLPAFLSEVALDAGDREVEGDSGVKMMTLHSAKGLEFPVVFLAGLEERLFPHHRSLQERELLEEERRLCYVGITRAMKKLYLTYAEKRAFAGLSGVNRPSRFIDEIPNNLIETVNTNVQVVPAGLTKSRQPSEEYPYVPGQRIRHDRFGEGTVMSLDGHGESARVQINFAGNKKWLVLAYAKLTAL